VSSNFTRGFVASQLAPLILLSSYADNVMSADVVFGSDPLLANNYALDRDGVNSTSDLFVTVTDGVTVAVPGESVTYTIIAGNKVGIIVLWINGTELKSLSRVQRESTLATLLWLPLSMLFLPA